MLAIINKNAQRWNKYYYFPKSLPLNISEVEEQNETKMKNSTKVQVLEESIQLLFNIFPHQLPQVRSHRVG